MLDVGCGAGRHALYLQEQSHDVVGIDVSPDWFDYLLADPDETADIVTETPWRVSEVIKDEGDAGAYVGVLEKATVPS